MKEAEFRYLNFPQVTALVGLTKTPLRKRIKAGTFPSPVVLSSRCVRFRSDEVATWMEAQVRTGIDDKAIQGRLVKRSRLESIK